MSGIPLQFVATTGFANCIASVISVGVLLFYYFKSLYLNHDFSIVGACFSLLTYGSFIIVLVYPKFRIEYDATQTRRLLQFINIVFVVETVVGLLQVFLFVLLNMASFDAATGDVVQGTINPLSFINEQVGFNNQVFTINYIFLLIYQAPYLLSSKRKYLLFIGGLVIIFASVLHVLLSFILALITCFLLVGLIRFRKQLLRFLLIGSVLIGLLIVTQPKNFSLFSHYYTSLISLESPKSMVMVNTIAFLPEQYPDALLLGLGPGQYTSRASLISSGRYFGEFDNPTKLPFLSHSFASKAFNDYIFDIWESYATNIEEYGNSTMSRPFFSVLSVIVEFGFIAFVLLVIIMMVVIFRTRRRYLVLLKEKKKVEAYYCFLGMISILAIFYLAFFENYLESSASICSGMLLMKYFNNIRAST